MPAPESLELFAACTPGLEPLLQGELVELGIAEPRPDGGGVAFSGSLEDCYRVNLRSRLAIHVLARVAKFRCLRMPELRRKAANVAWSDWLPRGIACAVRARSKKSKLYHSGAIEQRVREALVECGCAEQRDAAEADDVGVGVHVRFDRDLCTLSIDTSGVPLHRRGWRLDASKAPLREDLAAAVIRASGWDRESPLVDPFAGSGTLAIEAALFARSLASNRLRPFAFEQLAIHDAAAWDRVREHADAIALTAAPAPIVASDRDPGAVSSIVANAARAGVAADLQVAHAPLSAAPIPAVERGIVVCNPPHGRRIGDPSALRDLYAALGKRVRTLGAGWQLVLVTSDRDLARRTGLALGNVWTVDHGGTKIHLFSSARSARKPQARSKSR